MTSQYAIAETVHKLRLNAEKGVMPSVGRDLLTDAANAIESLQSQLDKALKVPASAPEVPQFEFVLQMQLWREDPYYVASSRPMLGITVTAPNIEEARRIAISAHGEAPRDLYWRFWTKSTKQVSGG